VNFGRSCINSDISPPAGGRRQRFRRGALGVNARAIKRQLAHTEQNAVSAAYNFAEHLPERRKMMQAWADYLDGLKAGAEVIPLFKKA